MAVSPFGVKHVIPRDVLFLRVWRNVVLAACCAESVFAQMFPKGRLAERTIVAQITTVPCAHEINH